MSDFLYTGDGGVENVMVGSHLYLAPGDSFSRKLYRRLNSFPDVELWVKVRTEEGDVGWLQEPRAKGMSINE